MDFSKKQTNDCCSGKTVYKYKLTSLLTESTIQRIRTLDTFTFEIHNGRFMLSADQGRTTLPGILNRPHLRVVLMIQDDRPLVANQSITTIGWKPMTLCLRDEGG